VFWAKQNLKKDLGSCAASESIRSNLKLRSTHSTLKTICGMSESSCLPSAPAGLVYAECLVLIHCDVYMTALECGAWLIEWGHSVRVVVIFGLLKQDFIAKTAVTGSLPLEVCAWWRQEKKAAERVIRVLCCFTYVCIVEN